MTMSGGRVGIPKLGLLSRTLGLTMILGHQGFKCLTSTGPILCLLLRLSRYAKICTILKIVYIPQWLFDCEEMSKSYRSDLTLCQE